MSWTAPSTNVAGTLITASWGNSNVRDNTLELRGTPANRCSAYHSTTQSVTSGSADALNLNTEEYDTATMHDTSTNNQRIVVPSGGAGVYFVNGRSRVQPSGASVLFHLRKNGSGGTLLETDELGLDSNSPADWSNVTAKVTWFGPLVATDYLELIGAPTGATAIFGDSAYRLASRLQVIGPLPAA